MQQILKTLIGILRALLLNQMLDYLHRFEAHGLSSFVEEWNETDYLMNKLISVTTMQESIEAGKGINEQGHLLMKLKMES